ncbi:hypothetical protein, partial [Pseudoalteromonas sp. S409]|uniref:hypothetical protein n=1 Tax=Pseudoalteromonas sp. S409 TaxID=2066518 RepID=UPI001BB0F5A6
KSSKVPMTSIGVPALTSRSGEKIKKNRIMPLSTSNHWENYSEANYCSTSNLELKENTINYISISGTHLHREKVS